jgi:hypothetical protein
LAHAYNPSFSGGRDQEDCDSKPAWVHSLRDPILKKLFTHTHAHTQRLAEWLKLYALISNPSTAKKKKKKKRNKTLQKRGYLLTSVSFRNNYFHVFVLLLQCT